MNNMCSGVEKSSVNEFMAKIIEECDLFKKRLEVLLEDFDLTDNDIDLNIDLIHKKYYILIDGTYETGE